MKFILTTIISVLATAHLYAQQLLPSDTESKIAFSIKNMGITVDGTLKGLKGKILFDPSNIAASSFDVTVDVNTINTGNSRRDAHLKKSDFFDVANYHVIAIKSTKIQPKQGNIFYAEAQLTMHGITKHVQFDFIATPQNGGYLFTANLPVNRIDFGVGKKSMTLSDEVKVAIKVYAKK